MFRKCSKLLYGKRHLLTPKWAVYWSYVNPKILCGSNIWCLRESKIGINRVINRDDEQSD